MEQSLSSLVITKGLPRWGKDMSTIWKKVHIEYWFRKTYFYEKIRIENRLHESHIFVEKMWIENRLHQSQLIYRKAIQIKIGSIEATLCRKCE